MKRKRIKDNVVYLSNGTLNAAVLHFVSQSTSAKLWFLSTIKHVVGHHNSKSLDLITSRTNPCCKSTPMTTPPFAFQSESHTDSKQNVDISNHVDSSKIPH